MHLRPYFRLFAGFILALAAPLCQAAEPAVATLRVGVLQFGTVNWELDVMQDRKSTRLNSSH